ncbi:MAG: bifunctional methylenetetrahydrofolate dehydrogenase/methenyltetrahydrofolate cyclohydrolase FolD [Verrucomicrobia bacterium]|nr:bifunctional methylenetetrahydrofolate dehydrogenase/methenyltetrahydrofolate cyclohydrolase FolD [Verrucomicrobiota bacterium]
MKLLQGNIIASQILDTLQKEISGFSGRKPGLAFIRVGENPASKVYIALKKKKCAEVGILSFDHELPDNTTDLELTSLINNLNQDPKIDGVLLQLPIPSHLDSLAMIEKISPLKDVDGFHPFNMGRLLLGNVDGLIACTPKGIHRLLVEYKIPIEGKHVVIVGRSNIVGKPLAALLMQKHPHCNATITVVHSHTNNLESLCQKADILIAAMGKPKFITEKMVKPGAVVIDVGINKVTTEEKSSLVGDVDFEKVAPLCSYITPVPGGVGPMTIALLLENTVKAYRCNLKL